MPKIHVTTRNGNEQALETSQNQTLMEAIRDNGIDDMEAICGGCCSCATCHVYIETGFTDRLSAVSEDEKVMLEGSEYYRPGSSRLSCQVQLSEKMNGLRLTVAPEG